jgi:LPXTG-motif cell wall-anchored protein
VTGNVAALGVGLVLVGGGMLAWWARKRVNS